MKTFKAIKNLITGKDIKEMELKPVNLKGLMLKDGHILFCYNYGLCYVKAEEDGFETYTTEQIFTIYGVEITDELINKLSIK
jgi:hypothetical protein